MKTPVNGTFYLALSLRTGIGEPCLNLPRITKNKPSLGRDEIMMQLDLRVPRELFAKPTLQADITIPSDGLAPRTINADIIEGVRDLISQAGLAVELNVTGADVVAVDDETRQEGA